MKIWRILSISAMAISLGAMTPIASCVNKQEIKVEVEESKPILEEDLDIDENGVLHGFKSSVTPGHLWGYDTLVIPKEVREIAPFAFAYRFDYQGSRVTTIDWTNATNLVKIGDNAFNSCTGLTCDIDLSSLTKLEYIGKNAFFYCSRAKSLTINENVNNLVIGESAFNMCYSLESINIPANTKSLGSNAFEKCQALHSIDMTKLTTFPDWLQSSSWIFNKAGSKAKEECIAKINFLNLNLNQWKTILNDRQALPEEQWKITSARATTESDFTYGDSDHKILTGIKTGLGTISSLVIPDCVEEIKTGAFDNCSYFNNASSHIPLIFNNKLKTIGNNAFYKCAGLSGDLVLPPNLSGTLGSSSFEGCSQLRGIVTIPSGVTKLHSKSFYGTSITGIKFHKDLKELGTNVFTDCEGLSFLDVSCYPYDAIQELWPRDEDYNLMPFYGLGNNGAILMYNYGNPDLIKTQWEAKFTKLGLKDHITTGNDLTKWTMHLNDDIAKKEFPEEAYDAIDKYDLRGFKNDWLSKIDEYGQMIIPNTTLSIAMDAFSQSTKKIKLHSRLILNTGLKKIGADAFFGQEGIWGGLTLPNTISEIGVSAFYNCKNLQGNLIIPNSSCIIRMDAFTGTNLNRIEFPQSFGDGMITFDNQPSFVIDESTKILDFTSIKSMNTNTEQYFWIRFNPNSSGKILVSNQQMVKTMSDYFTEISNKFDIGYNPNNWSIEVAEE